MNQGTEWVLLMKKKTEGKKCRASVPLSDGLRIKLMMPG
jgi:hypothetical protein